MENKIDKKHPAVVLSMFETGLGIARSLGRKGITVYGFDFKKDVGFYSRYTKSRICPHPLKQQEEFIEFLIEFAKKCNKKPALFIASDNFLLSVSRNREKLKFYYLFNLPDDKIIESIFDKYEQYKLAKNAGIPVPKTIYPESKNDLDKVQNSLRFPVFIKAKDVNFWRNKISGTLKGFIAKNKDELITIFDELFDKDVRAIAQEIIKGPDTNHYKICSYISISGEFKLNFTLQKIRQNPIHFGVGAVVKSVHYSELVEIGKKLFSTINYCGVGSAEFKIDERDGKLKLIELNPRYWQQNSLADKCGMNFPLINYLDLTGQNPEPISDFEENIKWVNIYMDFDSFLKYKKEGSITFWEWLKSLKGEKILSDYALDDVVPGFYEIGFGKKLLNFSKYLLKHLK